MDNYINQIARSIGFLSRLPVPQRYFDDDDDGLFTETSGMFVIAGCLIAMPVGFAAFAFHIIEVNSLIIAAAVLAGQTLITGALHEDGFSDSLDGLWGGRTKQKMLKIMHDSRLGTYGTLGLIFSILLKFVALSTLASELSATSLALTIIIVSGLSRGMMIWHWNSLMPARKDGVASSIGAPSDTAFTKIIICSALLVISLTVIGTPMNAVIFSVLLASGAVYWFTRFVEQKIEGHTGDTIGASQQIAELALLLVLAISI